MFQQSQNRAKKLWVLDDDEEVSWHFYDDDGDEDDDDGLDTRICAGIGLAVPLPPQVLHLILPVPPHVLHPTSSSDHLVHKQGTLLDPLHVGHWMKPRGTDLSWSASIMDFIIHAPASALIPCTT